MTRPIASQSLPHVLDNPVWRALTGPQAPLAERVGQAVRFQRDVSPFAAIADVEDPRGWRDLATLAGPRATAAIIGLTTVPPGWEIAWSIAGVQLVATDLREEPDDEALRLTADDVPEMLDLVARAEPGPFRPRTIEMGRYLGIRRGGALVAMAGERLHPPGWTEISAVCTDAAYRGQGLATRLVRAVAYGIRERGESSFLHAASTNTNAVRLYESIDFTLRRGVHFTVLQSPAGD